MKELEDRFALYVDPGTDDECWEWMGGCQKATGRRLPYGQIRVKIESHWETAYAHRVAFFLAAGYWPTQACHTCDNPRCVNPNHLYDGTVRQNIEDAVVRGRFLGGPRHTNGRKAKGTKALSIDRVQEVRRLYGEGMTQRQIADMFGITQGGVSSIVRGRTRVAV
jgi:hypothetical protein